MPASSEGYKVRVLVVFATFIAVMSLVWTVDSMFTLSVQSNEAMYLRSCEIEQQRINASYQRAQIKLDLIKEQCHPVTIAPGPPVYTPFVEPTPAMPEDLPTPTPAEPADSKQPVSRVIGPLTSYWR